MISDGLIYRPDFPVVDGSLIVMTDSETVLSDGSVAAILPAAGSGQRFGSQSNKLFALLLGKPLWVHAVQRLAARREVGRIVMSVSEQDHDTFSMQLSSEEWGPLSPNCSVDLVLGGAERSDSVWAALSRLENESSVGLVAVHDAARPLVRDQDLAAVFATAATVGAAILAAPLTATLKRDLGGQSRSATIDRRELWTALTPQVFRVGLLIEAYRKHNGRPATDDAQLVERIGHDVALVPGATDNLKITYPEDLLVAEAILTQRNKT